MVNVNENLMKKRINVISPARKRTFGFAAIGVYSCLMLTVLAAIAGEKYLKYKTKTHSTSIAVSFRDEENDKSQ